MQCGKLDGILEEKRDGGKTGEIRIRSVVSSSLVLITGLWLCKMLALGETGWGIKVGSK